MTDIYDFRDPVFTTYKKEWHLVYRGIWEYVKLKKDSLPTLKFKKLFKRHLPKLWDDCPDEVIHDFLFRASQIAYHEIVYIPSKESQ